MFKNRNNRKIEPKPIINRKTEPPKPNGLGFSFYKNQIFRFGFSFSQKPTQNRTVHTPTGNGNAIVGNMLQGNKTSGIRCYNYRGFGHRAKECKEKRMAHDSKYHKENMLLCKKDEARVPLTTEEYNFLVDADREEELDISANCIFMATLQEAVSNFEVGAAPTYDTDGLAEVQNSTDTTQNVYAHEWTHPEQPEFTGDTYREEHNDSNITSAASYMSPNEGQLVQGVSDCEQEYDMFCSQFNHKMLKLKNVRLSIMKT